MRLKLAILTLLLLFAGACCHGDTETGTGRFICPTYPESISLECSGNAVSKAKQDATAKANTRCTAAGGTLKPNPKWEEGTSHCVKVGNDWFVEIQVTGTFQCCK